MWFNKYFLNILIEIFPDRRKTIRGSSGNWVNDSLTSKEKEKYKQETTFK